MNDELFQLWIKSICEKSLKIENEAHTKEFENAYNHNIVKNSQFYDPHFNFNTEFLEGIDTVPKQIWNLYRPCSNYNENFNGGKLEYQYKLKVISPITLSTSERSIELKENNLIKRYYNSYAKSIIIFYFESKPNINIINIVNTDVINIKFVKIIFLIKIF